LIVAPVAGLRPANQSNRFFGDLSIKEIEREKWVWYDNPKGWYFAYKCIGTSPSGIHILLCQDNGGGSGVFISLIFLILQTDEALKQSGEKLEKHHRVLLKTLGSIGLGDRYYGQVSYENNVLKVGKDLSPMKHGGLISDLMITVR
jgi:hypothetical protein